MEDKDKPTDRHKELSLMFLKMGRALVKEGLDNNDFVTASLGNNMVLMSSIAFDKHEVRLFGELASMMSSRRLVKKLTNGTFDVSKLEKLRDSADEDPFQQIMKRIKKDLDNYDEKNKGEDNETQ